jgi:hypothetical protein
MEAKYYTVGLRKIDAGVERIKLARINSDGGMLNTVTNVQRLRGS